MFKYLAFNSLNLFKIIINRFFQNSVKINTKNLKQALVCSLNDTKTSENRELENTSVRLRSTRQTTKNQQDDLYETEITKLSESIDDCKDNSGK